MLGPGAMTGVVVEGITRATGCGNRTRDGRHGGGSGRTILTRAGGAKLMNLGPIRRGRGKGGHSAESKSIELLELLELLEGAYCGRGWESWEQTEGRATIGRCSLEWQKSWLHDGRRVWWHVVPDGRQMMLVVPTSRFAASNDCNFVGCFVLSPAEKQQDRNKSEILFARVPDFPS